MKGKGGEKETIKNEVEKEIKRERKNRGQIDIPSINCYIDVGFSLRNPSFLPVTTDEILTEQQSDTGRESI